MPLSPAARPAVILVVDDEPCVLNTLRLVLTHAGYTVLATLAPAEALAIAAGCRTHVDLLLADVVMPEQSGPDLAAEFLNAYPDTRVLFTAGMPNTPEIYDRVLSRGFSLLPKPFLPSTLLAAVERELHCQACAATA
jgi:two-component system, cell cycle sensor histidine kinase and response regulator CckA